MRKTPRLLSTTFVLTSLLLIHAPAFAAGIASSPRLDGIRTTPSTPKTEEAQAIAPRDPPVRHYRLALAPATPHFIAPATFIPRSRVTWGKDEVRAPKAAPISVAVAAKPAPRARHLAEQLQLLAKKRLELTSL